MNAFDRFWSGFAISPAKLALFRVAFFGVLGIDAFQQIAHAPRYGFGGFNVPHFASVGALLPAPDQPLMLVANGEAKALLIPIPDGDAAAADLNRDGVVDIAIASHLRGLTAMIAEPRGVFAPWADGLSLKSRPEGLTSRAIELADWNGDGGAGGCSF